MPQPGDPATPYHHKTMCKAVGGEPGPFVCTEPEGHDGPHVASGVKTIVAVWED